MSDAIKLPTAIGEGKEREVQTLLADNWRRLVTITLRNGALLADHSARFPITIQAVLGQGLLRVGEREYALEPGTIVAVDAHAVHNVLATPELTLLVTFFRQPDAGTEQDTSAKFD